MPSYHPICPGKEPLKIERRRGGSGRERRRTEQRKGEVDSWPKDALGPFPPEGSGRAHDCRTLTRKPG